MIDVAAAIIYSADKNSILLSLRKPEQHQGDRWEFPGGKIENGESQIEALYREIKEELGIHIDAESCSLYKKVEHNYSDKSVRLHFWNVYSFSGEPQGNEGQRLSWFSIAELNALHFPDANQVVVDQLLLAISK